VIRGTGVVLRDALPWHGLQQIVGTAEETGHQAVFVPEIAGREAFSTLAGLAGVTSSVRLGSGVVTIRSRRPVTAAMAAATVQEMSGGRFVLGIGSGTANRSESASENPVILVRDYVRMVRAVFSGGQVDARDASGFALELRSEGPPPPIWLGALGDRMVSLAGAEADGVILNWCTPDRVARGCDTIRSAAEASGRDPSEVTVSVYVRACLGLEEDVAMRALRAATAQYASIPHYLRQMERMGLGSEGRQAAAAARAGRPDEVPESLVQALTVVGGRREWVARAEAFHRAGADLVLAYPVPALDPVSSILGTIMTAAPSPALER
jgi:alkanesulfonate monooxygenase SsuD/methylene tetrahydromethanopterin reductase-like flavin-dependent oxidoreductase (luciferase family)